MRRAVAITGALAAVTVIAPPAQAATVHGTCRGDDHRCVAKLSLHGGQSNTRVVINLTGTDMALRKVSVSPHSDQGAFSLSNASFRLGGSQYLAKLSAVDGIGRFTLTFVFKSR